MRRVKNSIFFTVIIFLFTGVCSCAPPVRQAGTQAIGHVSANVLSTQGQSLYNNGKYDEALPILQKWVLAEPNNWLSHNWLGWNYYNLKKYNEAIAELQKANAIKSDKSTFQGLGRCYYDQGAYSEAIGYFRMWVELDIANWAAHNWLGWTHLMLKQYNEAIAELQKANAIKSGISNFRGLGSCYYALEEYDKAIRALEEGLAIASDTTKGVLEFEMALCYIAKKDYPKAAMLLKGKGFLGIGMQKHEKGFEIQSVFKNGPADLAGLRIGDVLTEFKGDPLAGMDMERFLKEVSQNSGEASVKLLRQDTLHTATVVMDIMRLGETKIAGKTDLKPPGTETIRGDKWAVIIGVSNYEDSRIPSLRYASRDATSLYNWLVSQDGGRYSPSRVRLLTDESATSKNVKQSLFVWLKQAIAEDMVIIYFAGHGSPPSPDEPQNLFLLTYDTDFGAISSTGFPMWDVETALKRFIKAERVVVIADACHAGGVGSAFVQGRRSIAVTPKAATVLQSLTNVGKGIAVITASDDKQLSQEGQQWGGGHGVFTYHLLEGLKGEADYNSDSIVTLGELIPYLSQSVRRATQNDQSPTVAGRFDPAITVQK